LLSYNKNYISSKGKHNVCIRSKGSMAQVRGGKPQNPRHKAEAV
jgi:hypothetical protein